MGAAACRGQVVRVVDDGPALPLAVPSALCRCTSLRNLVHGARQQPWCPLERGDEALAELQGPCNPTRPAPGLFLPVTPEQWCGQGAPGPPPAGWVPSLQLQRDPVPLTETPGLRTPEQRQGLWGCVGQAPISPPSLPCSSHRGCPEQVAQALGGCWPRGPRRVLCLSEKTRRLLLAERAAW